MTKLQERLRGGMPTKVVGRMPLSGCREVDWDWQKIEAERLEAADALDTAEAKIARLKEERDRIERNRDMWKGQCERQAEQLSATQPPAVAEDDHDR